MLPQVTLWQSAGCCGGHHGTAHTHGQPAAHSHGHHHAHGKDCCEAAHTHAAPNAPRPALCSPKPQKPQHSEPAYQTARGRRLDVDSMKEGCACCAGGVPDGPDEIVGAAATGKHALTQAHGHSHTGLSLPDTPLEWGVGSIMAVFAGVGMVVGAQNLWQAWNTSKALNGAHGKIGKTEIKRMQARSLLLQAGASGPAAAPAAAPHKMARLQNQRVKNLEALENNLARSLSMQRFIMMFDGATVFGSGVLALGGVFMPVLAAVGTAVQMVYCAAHALRYFFWEKPRTATAKALRLKPWTQPLSMAQRGLALFNARQAQRSKVFVKTSLWFAAYGTGAFLLTLNAAAIGAGVLLFPGLGLFVAGIAAVLVLNNRHIIRTFFNNNEAHLEREHLGTKEAQLRLLTSCSVEQERADSLRQDLRDQGAIGGVGMDRLLGVYAPLRHWARRRGLRVNPGKPAQVAAEQTRRRALVSFISQSAAAQRALAQEEHTALQLQQANYAQKFLPAQGAAPAVVQDTLTALQQRAHAMQQQMHFIDTQLAPTAQAAAEGPLTQAQMFTLHWQHLSALRAGTPQAHQHLDALVADLSVEHHAGSRWVKSHNAQGHGLTLNPHALLAAAQASQDPRAQACLEAFCSAAQIHLIYSYRDTLETQMGSVVDHLSARVRRQSSAF